MSQKKTLDAFKFIKSIDARNPVLDQVRLQSAYSATYTCWNIDILHAASLLIVLSRERITEMLMSAGWFVPLLFAGFRATRPNIGKVSVATESFDCDISIDSTNSIVHILFYNLLSDRHLINRDLKTVYEKHTYCLRCYCSCYCCYFE